MPGLIISDPEQSVKGQKAERAQENDCEDQDQESDLLHLSPEQELDNFKSDDQRDQIAYGHNHTKDGKLKLINGVKVKKIHPAPGRIKIIKIDTQRHIEEDFKDHSARKDWMKESAFVRSEFLSEQ